MKHQASQIVLPEILVRWLNLTRVKLRLPDTFWLLTIQMGITCVAILQYSDYSPRVRNLSILRRMMYNICKMLKFYFFLKKVSEFSAF